MGARTEQEKVDRPHWIWWLAIPAGMTLTASLAISDATFGWFAANVTTLLPQPVIGAIFLWACWLHVKKGMRAVQMAERAGLCDTSLGWGWQTLLLGFASLTLLQQRITRRSISSGQPSGLPLA